MLWNPGGRDLQCGYHCFSWGCILDKTSNINLRFNLNRTYTLNIQLVKYPRHTGYWSDTKLVFHNICVLRTRMRCLFSNTIFKTKIYLSILASSQTVSSCLIQSHPVSSSFTQSHQVSASLIRTHPVSSHLIHSRLVSSSLI